MTNYFLRVTLVVVWIVYYLYSRSGSLFMNRNIYIMIHILQFFIHSLESYIVWCLVVTREIPSQYSFIVLLCVRYYSLEGSLKEQQFELNNVTMSSYNGAMTSCFRSPSFPTLRQTLSMVRKLCLHRLPSGCSQQLQVDVSTSYKSIHIFPSHLRLTILSLGLIAKRYSVGG